MNGERFLKNLLKESVILKQRRRLNVVFTSSELKPGGVSSRTSQFLFGTQFIQTNNKNKIINVFKILK